MGELSYRVRIVVILYEFIEFSQPLPHHRVEMILDEQIRPKLKEGYLPGSFFSIKAH